MARAIENLPMPAGYFKLVLELVGTTRARREALLEGTEIAPEAVDGLGGEVTVGQQLRQVRNANRLMPAGWGLAVGARFQSATHGFLGFGAVSAATLGEALAVVERFTSVRNPSLEAECGRRGDELHLRLRPRCELEGEEWIPLLESTFLAYQAIVESVLARPLDRGRLEMRGCPAHGALYRGYFHMEVRFGCEQDALVIPAQWLAHRSPLADADMFEASVRRLELLAGRLGGERFLSARVEQLLASGDDAGLPMDAVARLLGVSSRTLLRRLSQSGTSYRELRDAHRRRRARELLRTTRLSVGEIASRLGYEGSSNFGRACHRWFGRTPLEVRHALQARGVDSPQPVRLDVR